MHIISLGAGVQSTTMALMAAHGEITPMPDCAIFADTQWEPKAVYEHLRWLMSPNVLPFPIHVVTAGNIRSDVIAATNTTKQRFVSVPWFLDKKDGIGMGQRQCTSEYKILPLARKQRELLGYQPRQRIPPNSVSLWIGISMDEAMRMKPARNLWQTHRWPLIEKGINRRNCLKWLADNGYPMAPKSSCIGCPFHSDTQWRELRDNSPAEWADAVEVDRLIRNHPTIKGKQYAHRSCVPLDQADFRTDAEIGQMDLFNNECEGMCGV